MQGALAAGKDGTAHAGGCRGAMREFDPAFFGSGLIGSDPTEGWTEGVGKTDQMSGYPPPGYPPPGELLRHRQYDPQPPLRPPEVSILDFPSIAQGTPLPQDILLQGILLKVGT